MGENNVQLLETRAMCDLNKRVSDILSNTFLLNKRCFIIAGGPSLQGKFDFTPLQNEMTIGMNMTFEKYPTTLCHFRDADLYQEISTGFLDRKFNDNIKDKFEHFTGIKIWLAQPARLIYKLNSYVVNRIYTEKISYEIKEGIYAGTNSLFSAIMLACSMGCRDIYLIGADAKVTNKTHWHERYDHQINEFSERCRIFREEMDEWAPRFRNGMINITQLVMDDFNETSYNCFPKLKFKEYIEKRV